MDPTTGKPFGEDKLTTQSKEVKPAVCWRTCDISVTVDSQQPFTQVSFQLLMIRLLVFRFPIYSKSSSIGKLQNLIKEQIINALFYLFVYEHLLLLIQDDDKIKPRLQTNMFPASSKEEEQFQR